VFLNLPLPLFWRTDTVLCQFFLKTRGPDAFCSILRYTFGPECSYFRLRSNLKQKASGLTYQFGTDRVRTGSFHTTKREKSSPTARKSKRLEILAQEVSGSKAKWRGVGICGDSQTGENTTADCGENTSDQVELAEQLVRRFNSNKGLLNRALREKYGMDLTTSQVDMAKNRLGFSASL